jgi:DNA-directed RNA polymerase
MSKITEPWYAAKCIFRHNNLKAERDNDFVYEERIILLQAESQDSAIEKAEEEAKEYEDSLDGTEFLGYTMVYHLYEENIGDRSEIFSEMRDSGKNPTDYLDHFYDTGSERAKTYEI